MVKQVTAFVADDGTQFPTEALAIGHDKAAKADDWIVKYLGNTGRFSTLKRAQAEAKRMREFLVAYFDYEAEGDKLEEVEYPAVESSEEQKALPITPDEKPKDKSKAASKKTPGK